MTVPQAGSLLTPNIRLERPLARGGMGSVWLADHLGLRTKVFVKFIADEVASHPEVMARFEREAAAAAAVKSPHVVQMLDHGVSSTGLAYIAMEFLDGVPLADHLDHAGVLPPAEVAHLVSQAAKALGRAHDKGVVHRDIKPDNIFLCDDGEGFAFVKVLDFGIAKVGGPGSLEQTKTGAMLGTPYYMSPEQVMGAKGLDHRADVWALAVVAYEMLTGARPYDGETMGAISVRICAGEFALPCAVNPALPADLDALFAQALAKDLAWRFPTVRAFADALEHAAGGSRAMRLVRRKAAATVMEPAEVAHPSHAPAAATPPTAVMAPAAAPTPARGQAWRGSTVTPTVATPPPGFAPASTSGADVSAPASRRSMALVVLAVAAVIGVLGGIALAMRSSERAAEAGAAKAAEPTDESPRPSAKARPRVQPPAEPVEASPSASVPVASAGHTPTPVAPSAGPPVEVAGAKNAPKPSVPKSTAPATNPGAPAAPAKTTKAKTNDPDMF